MPTRSAPRITLECTNRIPHSRGLGSSAAAVVAGIALAGRLGEAAGGRGLTPEEILERAAVIEGHPDNAAPAIFGGLTISLSDPARAWNVPVRTLSAVTVLVPEERLDTLTARGAIPAVVDHAVAAENARARACSSMRSPRTGTPCSTRPPIASTRRPADRPTRARWTSSTPCAPAGSPR